MQAGDLLIYAIWEEFVGRFRLIFCLCAVLLYNLLSGFIEMPVIPFRFVLTSISHSFFSHRRSSWKSTMLICPLVHFSPDLSATWALVQSFQWFGKVWMWSRLADRSWAPPIQLIQPPAPFAVICASRLVVTSFTVRMLLSRQTRKSLCGSTRRI